MQGTESRVAIRTRRAAILAVLAAIVAAVAIAPTAALADAVEVNSTADPGDGVCDATACTLREAIDLAQANDQADVIGFAGGLGGTIQLTEALPQLTKDLQIQGPGADVLTVNGEGAADPYRIVDVAATVSLPADVRISGLTISGGQGSVGGGVLNRGATLSLVDVVVTRNRATPGIFEFGGGGIANDAGGTLTVEGSTIAGNVVEATGVTAQGGGIASGASVFGGALTLRRSTVSGNRAESDQGASGGGIALAGSIDDVIESTTFFDNEVVHTAGSDEDGASVATFPSATVTIQNSILAEDDAGAANCAVGRTSFGSGGHNLASDDSCNLTETGDQPSTDPGLEPLAPNGGTTPTHRIAHGSPAHDQGASGGLELDQRGEPRIFDDPAVPNAPGGDGADIGALELQTAPPNTIIDRGPGKAVKHGKAKFKFHADQPGASFECRLEGKRPLRGFKICTSPKKYAGLKPGTYTFAVRATNDAGLTDPTPATRNFTVPRR